MFTAYKHSNKLLNQLYLDKHTELYNSIILNLANFHGLLCAFINIAVIILRDKSDTKLCDNRKIRGINQIYIQFPHRSSFDLNSVCDFGFSGKLSAIDIRVRDNFCWAMERNNTLLNNPFVNS